VAIEEYAVSVAIQENAVDVRVTLNAGDITRENVAKLVETNATRFPLSFSFECYGIPFSADGVEGDEGPALQISDNLGPIPCTAESPEIRTAIGAILSLPPEFLSLRMSLSSSNDIVVEGELPLGGSITPTRILATASAFVASAKPLIEVIELTAPGFGSKIQLV